MFEEMTPEQMDAEMETFWAFQEELEAEEASLTPAEKQARSRAEAIAMQQEAIGEMYASRYAFE